MIFEPTQNSVNEDENEGSFSINEMVEEENQEEEEENKNEKEKKSGLEVKQTNKERINYIQEHLLKTTAFQHNGINNKQKECSFKLLFSPLKLQKQSNRLKSFSHLIMAK